MSSPDSRLEVSPRMVAVARLAAASLGTYALVGGGLSMLGWAADIRRLTDWQNSGISIQPNTSVAILLAGLALLLRHMERRRGAAIAAMAFGAIGGFTLLEYALNLNPGFDTALTFQRSWGSAATAPAGRMGLPAALSLTLLSLALLLSLRGKDCRQAAAIVSMVVLGIAGFSQVGYLFRADMLYALPALTAIAWQTSTFLVALSLGVMLTITDRPPTSVLVGRTAAGALARRSLPLLILVPLAVAWIRWIGEQGGVLQVESGVATLALVSVLLNALILGWGITTVAQHERAVRENRDRLDAISRDAARSERLLAGIGELTARWRSETDPEGTGLIEAIASRVAVELRLSRCAWGTVDVPGDAILIEADHHGHLPTLRGRYGLAQYATHIVQDGLAGRTTVMEDLASDPRTAADYAGLYEPLGIRAHVGVPLHRDGQWVAIFGVSHHEVRHWTTPEIELLRTIADRMWLVLERSRAELAIRLADRRKDIFLATLAHELRNPLAPIVSSLEVVRQTGGDNATTRQATDIMDRQLKHMVRLIDDLMDVSRISRDKLELQLQDAELGLIVRRVIETLQPLIERSELTLRASMPEYPIPLKADRVRLTQVVDNLLTNARKYTNPGGLIELTLRREGLEGIISIRDTGIGIPPDRLASIFDMFSQVDASLDRSRGGMGVGLSLVRRLVELHGGRVEAASDGPGTGSIFTVRLPVLAGAITNGEAKRTPVEPGSRRRILVVDDNIDAAKTLALLLQVSGHEVVMAHDGHDAVHRADDYRPEAVLLDLGLPGMDGYEVCRTLRATSWGARTVIVAVSGWGQEEDRRRSHEAGFDGHLVKPVERDVLLELVAQVAAGREAEAAANRAPV